MPTVSVVRTYLEMRDPAALRAAGRPPDAAVALERLERCSPPQYRALYALVGRDYHWRDRLAWSDERLAAHLARPEVELWELVTVDDAPRDRLGYFELERGADGDVEISYFGLAPAAHGRGLGTWMRTEAVRRAWDAGARRVWLHTCTLDSPAALPNYLARGFVATRTETYETELLDLSEVPPHAPPAAG